MAGGGLNLGAAAMPIDAKRSTSLGGGLLPLFLFVRLERLCDAIPPAGLVLWLQLGPGIVGITGAPPLLGTVNGDDDETSAAAAAANAGAGDVGETGEDNISRL
mmetsp:Transcript_37617/g.74904  ORF Transcript_37617/g.74904 Transcript_37617/m.74904 type:complete len:104 (+) Transcript_37617:327-638(+)